MLYDPMKDYNEKGRLLLKAANYMEEHGHCKFTVRDEAGRVCLWGALIYAEGLNDHTPTEQALKSASYECLDLIRPILEQKGHTDMDSIPIHWNNKPERTKDEVVAILRETAETQKLVTV